MAIDVCGGEGIYIDPPEAPDCECCEELRQELERKQDTLTAGENITIVNNVISATGGGGDMSNYYTKAETDALLNAIETGQFSVVQSLPATGDAKTIYLVPKTGGGYQEYIYVDGGWEEIGDTDIDLSNYYTKTQVDALLADKQDKLTAGSHISIAQDGTISATAPTKAELLEILGYRDMTIVQTDENDETHIYHVLGYEEPSIVVEGGELYGSTFTARGSRSLQNTNPVDPGYYTVNCWTDLGRAWQNFKLNVKGFRVRDGEGTTSPVDLSIAPSSGSISGTRMTLRFILDSNFRMDFTLSPITSSGTCEVTGSYNAYGSSFPVELIYDSFTLTKEG